MFESQIRNEKRAIRLLKKLIKEEKAKSRQAMRLVQTRARLESELDFLRYGEREGDKYGIGLL